ncbi:unnamed protein product [Brassica oleracea var. botrytis]
MNPDTSTGPDPAPVLIFGGFVTISSGSVPAPSLISGVLSTLFTTRRVLDETGNEEVVVSALSQRSQTKQSTAVEPPKGQAWAKMDQTKGGLNTEGEISEGR